VLIDKKHYQWLKQGVKIGPDNIKGEKYKNGKK